MAAQISYVPEPHERAYYEGLFQAADVQKAGSIGGGEAVQFFSRSKLPMEVLKNIWTVADQPSTSSLDRQKFAVAIRLIQLTQNGTKGQGANLATAPGVTLRPAFLEGVSGVSVPLPQAGGAAPAAPPATAAAATAQQQPPGSPGASTRSGLSSAIPPPGSVASGYAPPPPPNGSSGGGSVAPGPNNALVTQDPYSMTPQEQGRYEALFPQYAKPDGFMYGKEAVDLFMKSGVDAQALREIWNLADRPVDNRLDKLEFAICMHLIVCISKKNLPAPQGQLPPSLRALKNPQAAQSPPPTPQQQAPPAGAGMPPPTPSQQQQPSLQPAGGMSISDAFEGMDATPVPEPAPAPEPAPTPAMPSYVPEQQQQQQMPPPVQPQQGIPAPSMDNVTAGMAGMGMAAAAAPSMMEPAAPAPAVVETVPEPPAPSSQDLAKNYQMGDQSEELSKLKDVLQKLQAENISLKAQLGSMTEEEKDVHKELGATVAEIGNLSQQLQGLRMQVSDAKTKLLEASAKLKAAQEQKGVLTDLIAEANATKGAIEEATTSIENVTEASMQHQQAAARQQQDALEKSNNFESNLFGFESAPPPAVAGGMPIPMPAPGAMMPTTTGGMPSPMPAPGAMMATPPAQDGGLPAPDMFGTQSFDSGLPPQTEVPLASSSTDAASLMNQPASSPQGGMGGFPDMGPSASTDSSFPPQEVASPSPGPNPFGDEQSAVSGMPDHGGASVDLPSPSGAPPATEQQPQPPPQQYQQPPPPAGGDPGLGIPTPAPPQQYQQPLPPPSAGGDPGMAIPPPGQPYGAMPPPGQPVPQAMPTPQTQQAYMPQQTPIATPQYGLARPGIDHNRKESVGGFGGDWVMGGTAPPPGAGGGVYEAAAAASAHAESNPPADNSEAVAKLEELRKKLKSAQEIASEAATSHIKLAQEADELRGDADKAEASARSLRASADEKKKGRFGGSSKKKAMNRDADSAAQTANDLRKRFLAVQAQASDASAVAMETKREAERLKEEVEKAELDMAAAASMQDQRAEQAKQSAAAAAAAPPAGYQQQPYGYPPAANGYPPAYGQPPPPAYGAPPAGYGAQVPGYAYAPPPQHQQQAPPPQYQTPYEGDPGFPSSPY